MAEIPVLLLAAGASSRMGQPKQLLPCGNNTLIEHQVHSLKKIQNPIFVILGSNSDSIIPLIEKQGVQIIVNDTWEMGLGNSIACGLKHVLREMPDLQAVLIVLLDQPFISVNHFRRMISEFRPGIQQIIVSASQTGWRGVPALFDRCYFDDLEGLNGDSGAKKIIEQNLNFVTAIICEECLDDIDTPESYKRNLEKFMNSSGSNFTT
ncbi:MAG TPA: nucleotidyltransferase family protein [Bacteroidales bacterium]|nr:nucleotidyltransferase family protein [Bacteroidales bacterium]